jgi:hypothetical protein
VGHSFNLADMIGAQLVDYQHESSLRNGGNTIYPNHKNAEGVKSVPISADTEAIRKHHMMEVTNWFDPHSTGILCQGTVALSSAVLVELKEGLSQRTAP